jgi:hypothetical protein
MRHVLILLTACLIALGVSPAAGEPKTSDDWRRHVLATAKPVHNGTCGAEAIGIPETRCYGYQDEARGLIWLMLFSDPADPLATIYVRVSLDEPWPVVVWCKPDFCPKGMT